MTQPPKPPKPLSPELLRKLNALPPDQKAKAIKAAASLLASKMLRKG